MRSSIIIIIILLQECYSFYFWNPAEVPRMQGSTGFCSLVAIFHDLEHPTFANLWQSCHILVLLSTSFLVFLFLSHQLLRVVPLLDPFLHPFSPHVPTIATFSLRNSSNITTPVISRIFSLFILSFKVFPHIIRNILISVVFSCMLPIIMTS